MTEPDAGPWAPVARPDLRSFVPRERRVGPLLLWLGCLAGALVLLLWLGEGRLAAPDLTQPSSWATWAQQQGTAAAVVAVLRIVALGLAWYLVGVTFVSVLAHALRAARLVRLADALSLGPVRSVVQQALGVGLAVGVVASALPPSALGAAAPTSEVTAAEPVGDAPSATVAAVPVDDGEGLLDDGDALVAPVAPVARGETPSSRGPAPPVPGPRLVATPLAETAPAATDATSTDATSTAQDAARTAAEDAAEATVAGDGEIGEEPRDAVPTGAAAGQVERVGPPVGTELREVRVRSGDHLWGIAETDLRDILGRQPSEAEILVHWERVIAANADRLVVPSNPDLLRPGQLVVLPDVEVVP